MKIGKESAQENQEGETREPSEEDDGERDPGDRRDEAERLQYRSCAGVDLGIQPHEQTERHGQENAESEADEHALDARPGVGKQRVAERVAARSQLHKGIGDLERPGKERRADEQCGKLPKAERDGQREQVPQCRAHANCERTLRGAARICIRRYGHRWPLCIAAA